MDINIVQSKRRALTETMWWNHIPMQIGFYLIKGVGKIWKCQIISKNKELSSAGLPYWGGFQFITSSQCTRTQDIHIVVPFRGEKNWNQWTYIIEWRRLGRRGYWIAAYEIIRALKIRMWTSIKEIHTGSWKTLLENLQPRPFF